ncbi:MAG TPA: imidazolonepropionase [Bdellovibrionota bacterium]|jgi:imidazolonepropionase
MKGHIFRHISCLITNEGVAARGGVHLQEEDLGLIANAAVVHQPGKGVLWVGPDKNLPKDFRVKSWRHFDCNGLTAYPGLVDAHTHPVFAGDRALEFELRMRGAKYQEIAAAGGGILTTVKATREASAAKLSELLGERVRVAHGFGVRLMEAKSGYGLDHKTEIRSLEVIQKLKKKNPGVCLVPTCMAAHALPPEYKDRREEFVKLVEEKILPEVARKKLAEYVDVFCDSGFFSVEETLRIMQAAHSLRLSTRVHGEELSLTGIAERAAELGAHSVDHLLKVDDAGARALAKHGTVAVLLPGTALYLREPPAPARKLLDAGAVVALATDFNPGTCPTQNLPLIGTLSAITLGMTTAEIIAGLTWSAARSLRRETRYGTLLPGALPGPIFARGDHPSALFYGMAPSALPDPCSSVL